MDPKSQTTGSAKKHQQIHSAPQHKALGKAKSAANEPETDEFSFDDVFDTDFDDGITTNNRSHSGSSRSPSPPLSQPTTDRQRVSHDTSSKASSSSVKPSEKKVEATATASKEQVRSPAGQTTATPGVRDLAAGASALTDDATTTSLCSGQAMHPGTGGGGVCAVPAARAQLGTSLLPGALGLALAHSAPQPSLITSPRTQTSGRARRRSRKKKSNTARPPDEEQIDNGGDQGAQQTSDELSSLDETTGHVVVVQSGAASSTAPTTLTTVTSSSSSATGGSGATPQANPTLVLKNLPFDLKAEALLGVLHGLACPPENVALHYDSNGSFRGMAFVRYRNMSEAAEVHRVLNGLDISGRQVRIEYKRKPEGEEQRVAQAWREQLHEFKEDEDGPQELAFPPTLTSAQRRQIHTIADKLGLVHYSQRDGESRILIVSKRSRSIKINGRQRSSSQVSGSEVGSFGSPSAHSYGSSWSDRGGGNSWNERAGSGSLYGSSWSEREQQSPSSSLGGGGGYLDVSGGLGSNSSSWRPRSVSSITAHRSPSLTHGNNHSPAASVSGSVGYSRSSPFNGGMSTRPPTHSSSYSQSGTPISARERRHSLSRDRTESTPAFVPSRQPRGPIGAGFSAKHQQHVASVLLLLREQLSSAEQAKEQEQEPEPEQEQEQESEQEPEQERPPNSSQSTERDESALRGALEVTP
mmetsp:Transcript_41504/g.104680  ORF Transcript_41504/g.104680 Transcript_41504/m.104680 type:complete len:697 (+) Transcript_41504:143-2233(+)